LDGLGSVYVVGYTMSSDFPTTPGAYDQSYNSGTDAFISKLNPAGSALIFSTYFGGAESEVGASMALDRHANTVFCGYSTSTDLPTMPGAYKKANQGYLDAFVAKVDSKGSRLVCSTYLGGSQSDRGEAIALDEDGNAYVAGSTTSSDFPTTPMAFDTSNSEDDAFLSVFNSSASSLLYSTFFGGTASDHCIAAVFDGIEHIYLAGQTESTDLPTTTGAFDSSFNGINDAFVMKLQAQYSPQPPVRQTCISGDFNGNGFNDLAVDFGELGLFIWAGLAWGQLSGVNPEGLLVANIDGNNDDEIIGDFDGLGLWLWDSWSWTQLSGVNPEYLVSANFDGDSAAEVLADFGGLGVWLRNGGTWSNLSSVNSEWMVAVNIDGDPEAEAVVDFGLTGVWMWDGGNWTKLASSDIDFMIAANVDTDPVQEIIGDFGGLGLWLWDGTDWTQQLDPRNAEYLIAADTDGDGADELYINFGADGLWSWNAGTWLKEASSYPWNMIPANLDGDLPAEVVVDFGGAGLYNLNGGAWDQMTSADAEFVAAVDVNATSPDEIVADFGSLGLWLWSADTWVQISGVDPDSL
jgi:hypothetical protein